MPPLPSHSLTYLVGPGHARKKSKNQDVGSDGTNGLQEYLKKRVGLAWPCLAWPCLAFRQSRHLEFLTFLKSLVNRLFVRAAILNFSLFWLGQAVSSHFGVEVHVKSQGRAKSTNKIPPGNFICGFGPGRPRILLKTSPYSQRAKHTHPPRNGNTTFYDDHTFSCKPLG